MVITLALILAGFGVAGVGAAMLRKLMSHHPVIAAGELLVTAGDGEAIIDEVMPHSPELLRHPSKYVTVEFDPCEPPPPPCAGNDLVDEIRWELIIVRNHHHHGEELRLRIDWHVNESRTIIWSVKAPRH